MPLPPSFAPLHLSLLRTPYSVLCTLTFPPLHRPPADLHLCTASPPSSVLDPALCTLLRLRILPFHFSTFAPLHGLRNSRPLSSVLRTLNSVILFRSPLANHTPANQSPRGLQPRSPLHFSTGLRPICTFARFSHFMAPRISPYPPGLDRPSKIFRFMVYQKGPLRVGMIPPGGRRKAASLRLDLNPAQR